MPERDAHLRAGETATGAFALELTPERAGWAFSGLRVLELPAGGTQAFDTGEEELVVLPLEGACTVTVDDETHGLEGRDGVFAALTDFVYAPRDARVEIAAVGGGRFALPSARAARRGKPRYVAADEVAVELRGAGRASRQVNNFCGPDVEIADRLIAVEVLTPAGNWSSYPPHKHDEERPGIETALEEIYYFEVAPSPAGAPGLAYQRVYGSGPDREIDVTAEVRSGDAIVMPHGYHGPSMAAPGYDLYYLNVMAGPGERAWRFTDDPDHSWVRSTWEGEELDPRLPLTSAARRTTT
ncbi:MAG TPA: 5-deoxy-glucuronate isomerase [Solirubrobacteraceae bacterium]|nr:5-deoxy-glucuronate isomerase [Solirubrobacteraceae bacterium]